jgi:hypothetical protein
MRKVLYAVEIAGLMPTHLHIALVENIARAIH